MNYNKNIQVTEEKYVQRIIEDGGVNFHDFGLGSGILNSALRAQGTKQLDKLELLKFKKCCK